MKALALAFVPQGLTIHKSADQFYGRYDADIHVGGPSAPCANLAHRSSGLNRDPQGAFPHYPGRRKPLIRRFAAPLLSIVCTCSVLGGTTAIFEPVSLVHALIT